ncbi:MAG: hypothetical protein J6W09_11250 [Bacteroidales bacterium]|nr:hypothetical protein [Bacteroidales bacterium]
MKARILRTNYYTPKLSEGEIVEIIPGMETDAEGIWNAPAGKLVLCRKEDNTFTYASPLDMEIIEYDTVDWSAFRREAAKDILPSLIEKASEIYELESLVKEVWCKQAVEWADELIKQLKQE